MDCARVRSSWVGARKDYIRCFRTSDDSDPNGILPSHDAKFIDLRSSESDGIDNDGFRSQGFRIADKVWRLAWEGLLVALETRHVHPTALPTHARGHAQLEPSQPHPPRKLRVCAVCPCAHTHIWSEVRRA